MMALRAAEMVMVRSPTNAPARTERRMMTADPRALYPRDGENQATLLRPLACMG